MDENDLVPWEDPKDPTLDIRSFVELTSIAGRLLVVNTECIVCYTEMFNDTNKFEVTVIRLITEEDLTVKNRASDITTKLKDLGLI
jgi:hypothetical protein